jgi:hypothetical protein
VFHQYRENQHVLHGKVGAVRLITTNEMGVQLDADKTASTWLMRSREGDVRFLTVVEAKAIPNVPRGVGTTFSLLTQRNSKRPALSDHVLPLYCIHLYPGESAGKRQNTKAGPSLTRSIFSQWGGHAF